MSRNSNQLSVAELLARNGAQPATGGGRRRRGGRGLSVDDLSGDIPAVERNGSAHAAPDEADEADEEYSAATAGDSGVGAQDHGGERVSYAAPDPNNSPMSGPITVYNPLEPYAPGPAGDGAPARLGDPDPYAGDREQFPPAEEAPRRGGRRRRAEPDDDFAAFADDPGTGGEPNQSWETGPQAPGSGRAARRRAAEAAEAAAAAESAPAEPEAPADYGLPPGPGDVGRAPAPDFGGPDAGPSWPGQGFDGPPRLGPPGAAPPTEAWQAPETSADDPRPKLERRRRGARPLPEPASFPESPDRPNGDQSTVVWSPTDQGVRLRAGLQGLETPPRDASDFGGPGARNGRPGGPMPPPPAPDFGADQGFGPGPDFGADQGFGPDAGYGHDRGHDPVPGFAKNDIFATDVYGPMRPLPAASGERYETGEFEPEFDSDADDYDDPEDTVDANRLGRARSALGGRFGAAGDKFAATKARFGAGARTTDRETTEDPRKQWIVLGAQSVGAAIAGMLAFKGFEMLWEGQPLAALALAVVVILGLVALVRILRRGDDMFSTVIAVVVGVFVTLGPLAFLLSTG
ncbi:hypothetical protein [Nocardia grenadensis]|uniref:hypothetical protein n=1 Tax=Nocardia grenadensis TaxID=931537 RepID=UPI0007A3F40B|nr:hypothetical protein [Nocardia grenadensis]